MAEIIQYIFSVDFMYSVIRMSTPLIFAALAAVVGSKANILCVAFEGMMLASALGGVLGSAWTNSVVGGLVLGVLSGTFMAFIFGYFVLYLNTRPMLIGLALNILGSGGTVFALFIATGSKANSLSLKSLQFPNLTIPIIKDIPVLGPIISGHNVLTYIAIITVFIVNWFIFKSKLGLRIRSVGENPSASESVGINVNRTKLIAVLISGVLASLGGIYMSMGYLSSFSRDMVAGRGFIGIAAQNLGKGNPILTMLCTMIFGAAQAIGNVAQSFRMPSQFANMLPYVVTLLGLVALSFNKGGKKELKKAMNKEVNENE